MINDVMPIDAANDSGWMIHALLSSDIASDLRSQHETLFKGRSALIEIGDVSVVASHICGTSQEREPLDSQIRYHSTLVNELHRVIDILPFRFGVVMPESEMIHLLRQNANRYLACLAAIRGFTELNLRWAVLDDSVNAQSPQSEDRGTATTTGFEYLMSKLRNKQTGTRIEHELRVISDDFRSRFPCHEIKTQSSVSELKVKSQDSQEGSYVIARIELLVPRSQASGILCEASGLLLRSEKTTVASGPWPPYSFIELGNDGGLSRPMQRCAITSPTEAVS
ncbi:MAG: GvpL/GvpF family gas vesicle protein [Pirellula sp.]|nr:GvpL/GvpF family gas vesicle protein [Pirellula sp.]